MSESRAAIRFDAVVKSFSRRGPRALDSMSFAVPTGSICAFVGPNGAGKTTAFSLVGGFLTADAGTVEVLGEPGFDPWRLKGRLGLLPQDADLSDRHTPRELLAHLGRMQGLAGAEIARAVDESLDTVGLTERRNSRIATLSHGMRRRVAVASALLGAPELVLLDEPTAGLDPSQARQLRDALAAARGTRTLVISSHNLDELERLCDDVIMVDRGKCVRQGSITEVTSRDSLSLWLCDVPAGFAPIDGLPPECTAAVVAEGVELRAPNPRALDEAALVFMAALVARGLPVREVHRGMGLERRFFEDAAERHVTRAD